MHVICYFLTLDNDESEMVVNKSTTINSSNSDSLYLNKVRIEEQDAILLQQEISLDEELKEVQEKHQNVRLVYEKVLDNIKVLCRVEKNIQKDNENAVTLNQSYNLNESTNQNQINVNQSNLSNIINSEEEVLKMYYEFLEQTNKIIDSLYQNYSNDDFVNLMKEKGQIITESLNKKKQKTVTKRSTATLSDRLNTPGKHSKEETLPTLSNNNEYAYSDDELKEEDMMIKQEKDEMIRQFKHIV